MSSTPKTRRDIWRALWRATPRHLRRRISGTPVVEIFDRATGAEYLHSEGTIPDDLLIEAARRRGVNVEIFAASLNAELFGYDPQPAQVTLFSDL